MGYEESSSRKYNLSYNQSPGLSDSIAFYIIIIKNPVISTLRLGAAQTLRCRIVLSRKNELNKGYQNVFYLEQGVFPDYIITQTSPQKHICHISKPLRYFLARHYTLKKSFHVVDIESLNNWYDQLDALFIPFIGFERSSDRDRIFLFMNIEGNKNLFYLFNLSSLGGIIFLLMDGLH